MVKIEAGGRKVRRSVLEGEWMIKSLQGRLGW